MNNNVNCEDIRSIPVTLIKRHTVMIDPESAEVGGCWQGRDKDGNPCVWDPSVLEVIYDILNRSGSEPFFVDIGANTGYCALFPSVNPKIKGLAFEPNPAICKLLKNNIVLNGLSDNVQVLPLALSDKPGTAVLKIPASGKDSGLACLGEPQRFHEWREISVPMDTLDRVLARKKIPSINLIKIDTEGCELFVLKGAQETIKKHQPYVVCESWEPNTAQFGYHPDAIKEFMKELGYSARQIGKEDVLFVPKTTARRKTRGNRKVADMGKPADAFQHWRFMLSCLHRRLYYRDQSPASFQSLHDLASNFKPDVIVELGTMSGMPLRCWLMAAPLAKIKCVDLNFAPLRSSAEMFPLDLSRVELLQTDILKLDFNGFWQDDDRVLFFVDAHDVPPNVSIITHVLKNAVSRLPEGSLFVVDDLWYSQENVTRENAKALYRELVLPESDELLPFEAHYAPYHAGGSFWGFPEVIPLLHYVNKHAIRFEFTPGAKHAAFYTQKQPTEATFDALAFNSACGKISYHPLAEAVRDSSVADRVMPGVTRLYDKGDFPAALNLLMELRQKAPDATGFGYALALVLARAGEFRMAADSLRVDMSLPTAHPQSPKLYADIRKTFLRHTAPSKTRRPGVTFFAVPKAFNGHENIIQRNAVRSWLKLEPKPEIMLMGDDDGTAEICGEFGLRHAPDLQRNEFGTPLVDDVFLKAQELSDTETLCYINADIIVFDDFMRAVALAAAQFRNFLLVGARLDYDVTNELDFSTPDRATKILDGALQKGIMHGPTGMDYFIFKPGLWDNIPPFALGRIAWDTWLLHDNLRRKEPVIDCTAFTTIIHQNHGYTHIASGLGAAGCYEGRDPEAKRNRALAGPFPFGTSVNDAPFFMHKSGRIGKRVKKWG
ncbi:MAG: FkbM family methyltransferase [Desulfovibrio sp.]|jgi:FkbM family methyltransferase|nr:FkbM family methyltransferase [Desulfovibrio sp.]